MSSHTNLKLSILQFLQFFVWGSWFVTGGTYFLSNLHFSGREVALLYASFSIAATISPILIGVLADKVFAVEKLLSFLHIVGSILLLGISFTVNFTQVYILMFLYVLCYVPTFSLSSSISFHHIKNVKRDFPRIRVWGTIAWIIASSLISFLNFEDQAYSFQIASISSFVLGVFCLFLPHTPPSFSSNDSIITIVKSPEIKQLFRNKSLAVMLACVGLISIPVSYYYSFVNPFLNEVGVSNAASKMAIGQVTEIGFMLLLPIIFDRFKFKSIVFVGLLLWGVRYGLFMLGFDYNLPSLYIISLVLHGAAYVLALLSVQIYLDTQVPIQLRSTAQGFFSLLTMGIMAIIGASIAGEFVDFYALPDKSHNWSGIWTFPAVFGCLVAFVFYLLFDERKIKV